MAHSDTSHASRTTFTRTSDGPEKRGVPGSHRITKGDVFLVSRPPWTDPARYPRESRHYDFGRVARPAHGCVSLPADGPADAVVGDILGLEHVPHGVAPRRPEAGVG